MNSIFDVLLGPGQTPIRRELGVHIALDGEGNPRIEPVDGEAFSLSEEGSLNKVKISRDRFFACGCAVATSQIGGRCRHGACRKESCQIHHGQCAACFKSLCLECSLFLEEVRLCPRCYEPLRRKLARRKITRALLSPFTG